MGTPYWGRQLHGLAVVDREQPRIGSDALGRGSLGNILDRRPGVGGIHEVGDSTCGLDCGLLPRGICAFLRPSSTGQFFTVSIIFDRHDLDLLA